MSRSRRGGESVALWAVAAAALIAHAAIYLPYLPSQDGYLGPDYAYFLPQLLAGAFWFQNNGLFAVPWFTPAFCGGIPFYPNPQTLYYSLPQFLTFAVGPVQALQVTFVVFAAAGLAGFHLLLRKCFATSRWTALAGGVLFLFNGVYAYRFLIGHLTFHAFMLAPLVAACILAGSRGDGRRRLLDTWVLCGALAFAYMFQSGMVHILPPVILAIVVIALVHGLVFGIHWAPFLRLGLAGGIALGLSAAKLGAALAFIGLFPRDMLPLAGYGSLWQVFIVASTSLFVSPAVYADFQWLLNFAWYPDKHIRHGRHELEYGITFLPALLMGLWLIRRIGQGLSGRVFFEASLRKGACVGAIAALLALPIVLNLYDPGWNALLKQIPLFRSSFTLTRWFCAYIPVAILLAALAFEYLWRGRRHRAAVALAMIGFVAGMNAATNRDYYAYGPGSQYRAYRIEPVATAFVAAGEAAWRPTIDHIDGPSEFINRLGGPLARDDDALASNGSELLCYEPIFGHRLEEFPFQSLRPGPALPANGNILNVKNPACMLYPAQNHCVPGTHFTANERRQAANFLDYKPIAFEMPWWQHAANWINLSLLALVAVGIGISCLGSRDLRRVR